MLLWCASEGPVQKQWLWYVLEYSFFIPENRHNGLIFKACWKQILMMFNKKLMLPACKVAWFFLYLREFIGIAMFFILFKVVIKWVNTSHT